MITLSYIDKTTIKTILMAIISVLAIPYYFMAGGTLVGFIIVRLIAFPFMVVAQIGYHRWLCHNSFVPSTFGRYLMWTGIVVSGLGSPLHHVIAHRLHHAHCDSEFDPHSPNHHSWLNLWLGRYQITSGARYPKDFYRNKEAMFISNHYWKLHIAFNIVLAIIDFKTALIFSPVSFVLARTLTVIVNYNAHAANGVVAPRNLGTAMTMLTGGEGLHKNHHDNQASYSFAGPDRFDPGARIVENILMADLPLKKNTLSAASQP